MNSTDSGSAENAIVLLNASECLTDLEKLKRDFNVFYFLDLCAGIEAAILYDELHLIAISAGAEPILDPLSRAGVLYDARMRGDGIETVNAIMSRPRAAELMARLQQANYWDNFDRELAITAQVAAIGLPLDLAIEEDTQKTLLLPFRQMPIYLSPPTVARERNELFQAKLYLAERYADLSATMFAFRNEQAVHDLDRLELPPLALETLSRAHTFDELGEIILDQRHRYRDLRERFRTVRDIYASPDYTLKERYSEKKKLDADMKRISDMTRSVPTLLSLASDIEKVSEALAPAVVSHDLTKAGKLYGPIAKWIEERAFRWRMRPLVGLVEMNVDSTVREIANATRILFDHELNESDVINARKYADVAKKYVPPRVSTS